MKIREAKLDDVPALLAIYAQYIETSITFEYVLPTREEFSQRVVNTLREYPYLVAEDADGIIGYAYAGRFHSRAAFQWGAELSVYLSKSAQGKGTGTALYLELISRLKAKGIHTVYGCVTVPNPASNALHEKLGFHQVARFHNAGYKAGAWHDIIWFEKTILPYTDKARVEKRYRANNAE